MGRKLMRVPMDFSYPIGKVWEGYTNPFPGPVSCSACRGQGYNKATAQIAEEFYDSHGRWSYDYGFAPDGKPAERPPWRIIGHTKRWCSAITQDEVQALVDHGRLYDFTHTWSRDNGWKRREDGYIPTAEEVNHWNDHSMGHDGINRHILVETRAKRLAVYGVCAVCDGKGEIPQVQPELREAYEKWEKYEPPVGDGYQLWETTTEGSPKSPVFDSLDALCEWCEKNATTFADYTATASEWKRMLDDGMVHHREGNAIFI